MGGATGEAVGIGMIVLGVIFVGRAGTEILGVGAMTFGLVLMIVGAIVALVTFVLWSTASSTRARRSRRRRALLDR